MSALHVAGIAGSEHEVPWRHDYAELYWLSVIGPTTYLLGRRLSGLVLAREFTVDPAELSLELGLGSRYGPNTPLGRSLDRLTRFNLAERESDDAYWIRLSMPMLSPKQVHRLPKRLREQHHAQFAAAS